MFSRFNEIRTIASGKVANEIYPFLQKKLGARWEEKFQDWKFNNDLIKAIKEDTEAFIEETQGEYEFDESFFRSLVYNDIIPKLELMVLQHHQD